VYQCQTLFSKKTEYRLARSLDRMADLYSGIILSAADRLLKREKGCV